MRRLNCRIFLEFNLNLLRSYDIGIKENSYCNLSSYSEDDPDDYA